MPRRICLIIIRECIFECFVNPESRFLSWESKKEVNGKEAIFTQYILVVIEQQTSCFFVRLRKIKLFVHGGWKGF